MFNKFVIQEVSSAPKGAIVILKAKSGREVQVRLSGIKAKLALSLKAGAVAFLNKGKLHVEVEGELPLVVAI